MLVRMDSYDLFIAAPMSAIAPGDYATGRKDILTLMDRLSGHHKFGRIYFAGAAAQLPPIEIRSLADGDWVDAIAHFRDRMKEYGNGGRQG